MKKSIERDLVDLTDILENLTTQLQNLSQADMIDIAARLKPVAKACKTIDDGVKDVVKVKCHHKEGEIAGSLFKAVLKIVPIDRFNQTAFKEARPSMFQQYVETNYDERVTFELR